MERLKAEKIKRLQMESERKENQQRHILNLRIFTGFVHGIFFWRGVHKPNLESSTHMKNKDKTPKGNNIKY